MKGLPPEPVEDELSIITSSQDDKLDGTARTTLGTTGLIAADIITVWLLAKAYMSHKSVQDAFTILLFKVMESDTASKLLIPRSILTTVELTHEHVLKLSP